MRTRTLIPLLILIFCLQSPAAMGSELPDIQALISKIPLRPYLAMTGSEFGKYISAIRGPQREQAILHQLVKGNLPDFLRKLKPVQMDDILENGRNITATIFVMPDYLAIGSDHDFLRIPMDLPTATEIAAKFGFTLPTKKMVDAIFKQSAFHFKPDPMPAGPRMRSTVYYLKHDQKIHEQFSPDCPQDALKSGHKKDIVLTNRLARRPGKLAIYGWHRLSGTPIQPLCTVHRADYADYSHGVRLVSDTILLDGASMSIYEILEDPRLAGVLSEEGAIPKARQLMALHHPPLAREAIPPVSPGSIPSGKHRF